jgi:hypothetical protein
MVFKPAKDATAWESSDQAIGKAKTKLFPFPRPSTAGHNQVFPRGPGLVLLLFNYPITKLLNYQIP